MTQRGIGIRPLAKKSGVATGTISKLRSMPEEANPNLSTVRDLAEELGVEAWMLLAIASPIAPIKKGGHLKQISHLGYAMLKEFEGATDETKARALQHLRFMLEADEGKPEAAKRLMEAQGKYLI